MSPEADHPVPDVRPMYLDGPAPIYAVHHPARGARRGGVVIAGPFGVERERAYLTLVHWAAALAVAGFDVLRFDYRGTGESPGRFQDHTFSDWADDLRLAAEALAGLAQGVPLTICGIRLGGLLAASVFEQGLGNRLLTWAAPASGRAMLFDTLRRTLMADLLAHPDGPRRTRDQLVAQIESGDPLNVDGYLWSQKLWRDSELHTLRLPTRDAPQAHGQARDWLALDLKGAATVPPVTDDSHRAAVVGDRFWDSTLALLPNVGEFAAKSLNWLLGAPPNRVQAQRTEGATA